MCAKCAKNYSGREYPARDGTQYSMNFKEMSVWFAKRLSGQKQYT